MAHVKGSLEERVEGLSQELIRLNLRVAQLETQLGAVPQEQLAAPPPAPHAWKRYANDEPEDVSEEILNWAGRAHLLTRLSTLCFLLVVALILRTVTDNNLVNTLVGSALGMGYAAALMVIGAWGYHKRSPLAPVFAASGAVLICIIVVETHTRFASLPLVPAYLTLIMTGIGMAWVSYRHQKLLPISLGTLGMCLAGAAIDYPHPFFPYLSLILFAANILGYFAAQLKSCAWLRWIVMVVTMAMLQLWGIRLGMTLLHRETPPAELGVQWFLPTLACFTLLYLALAFTGLWRRSGQELSRFNFALPTLNVLWAFSAACYVSHCWWGSTRVVGFIGILVALIHFVTSIWLTGRKREGAPGTNSFAFAGSALSAAALPFASGSLLLSLPVLAVIGFFMALMSRKWQNGGIRLTAYLVQIYAALALCVGMYLNAGAAGDVVNALPAGLLAVISLYQYQWCRQYLPPTGSTFARLDPGDLSAVLLLIASLASGFVMARTGLQQALALSLAPAEVSNAFRCSQTILINASAIGIMLFAFSRRNKEIRNVAILVTLIGAVKVFLYDLLGAHGVPLVVSVFSFGLAAAIESVALGKWQKGAIDNGQLTIDNEHPELGEVD